MDRHMHFIEISANLSSSLSSIGDDDCSLDLRDEVVVQDKTGPPPQPVLEEEEDSLQRMTLLASSSTLEMEQLFLNSSSSSSFDRKDDVPLHITTSRKRTISQHDETVTTANSTLFDGNHRPRFYSEEGNTSRSQSQLSIRDVASMLGSLSILDSSEQLKSPAFHHRATCDQLPDAEELSKLGDDAEKSHRRNTHVVLIHEV